MSTQNDRYEDRPELATPPRITAMLQSYGGRRPDGKPLWRLILAQNKRIRAAGVMRVMPQDGADDTPQIDEQGTVRVPIAKPDRLREGVFYVPRYKFKGWILERWFPGSLWGSEDLYSARDLETRARTMGAWPRHGDYFMMEGPWPTIEAGGDFKERIRSYMKQEEDKPHNWASYIRSELDLELAGRERLFSEYEDHLSAIARGEVGRVLGSVSSAAQSVRNKIAVQIGGDDWHLGAF